VMMTGPAGLQSVFSLTLTESENLPIKNCTAKCPLNHTFVKVLKNLAIKAPAGNNNKKPMAEIMACAAMSFCSEVKGMDDSEDPLPLDDEGELEDVELESIVLVRSSVKVPESRCC